MMTDFQFPGRLVAGDKRAFGGAYPIDDHGTGFNNIECNSYPAAVNDRIWPVAHPLDPSRPTCVHYETHAGDGQPHYGSAGYRSEGWGEPHQGEAGMTEAYCYSVVIDPRTQIPGGWCILLQDHAGLNSGSWIYPTWHLQLHQKPDVDDVPMIRCQTRAETTELAWKPVEYGRELFCQVEIVRRNDASGRARTWLSWDKPLAADAPPTFDVSGRTQYGTQQYWKQGIYAGPQGDPASVYIDVTTCGKRDSIAAARAAAGGPWTGAVTPPPPPGGTVKGSIAQGDTLKGTIVWTADNGPCDFTIDGKLPWHENNPPFVYNGDAGSLDTKTLADGPHTFKVALSDGSASHEVVATVKNAVVPPPPDPTNAQLRDKAVTALLATTISYPAWQKNVAAGKYPAVGGPSQWGIAFEALGKIM